MSCRNNDDDTVEIPILREQAFEEESEIDGEQDPTLDELSSLSVPEREWLMWFYSLSKEDQMVVETCADRGVSVNATNIEQMKRIVRSHLGPKSRRTD